MDRARTYRITWTRDPRRESAALLMAVRGKVLIAFVVVALIGVIVTAIAHVYLISLVIILMGLALPVNARGKLRRSLANTDPNVRVVLSDNGVTLGKGEPLSWDTFTHWRETPHDIVLLQQPGWRAKAGILIPRDAIPDRDSEGLRALLDKHLVRQG